jgi:DNA-directed RNA polymerase specialized sigma24 family protein
VTTGHELLGALTRLRDAARGTALRDLARERADWRIVETLVKRTRAAQGADGDDVLQETLLAIARHVADLDARDAGAAVAWCTRIASHKKIDLARARVREGQKVEARDPEVDVVDLLERDDGHAIDDRALAVLIEGIDDAIVRHVDGLGIASAAERQLKRTQARATLHRVMGAETDQLRSVLALEPTFGSDRLAKWVERGRPLLLAVVERLAWDHEGNARDVLFSLRDLVLARRVDAGVARPKRRKTTDEESP